MSPKRRRSRARSPESRRRRDAPLVEAEVQIDSLAAGGDGVGRLPDGRVVFVRLVAPGDRVRIQAPDSRDSFLRATRAEVLVPGPGRVQPACPVFGRCGGCAWQHLDYAVQLGAKQQILSDALERIGKLPEPPRIEVVASPNEYSYRGRARLHARAGRVGYRRHHEHAIEPIEGCPVLAAPLEAELGRLAERLARKGDESGTSDVVQWELALSRSGDVRCFALEGDQTKLELRASDTASIEIEVAGEVIRVGAGGFAQSNVLLFDALFERACEGLAGVAATSLLELYAGAGFFTLGLARRFDRVVAVESDANACRDLASNLSAAGISNVEVRNARVEDVVDSGFTSDFSAVMLDPPRTGLARGVVHDLAALGASRIVYLSCDAATLARDLGLFHAEGYPATRLTLIDLFPQTPHIETLAVLERESP